MPVYTPGFDQSLVAGAQCPFKFAQHKVENARSIGEPQEVIGANIGEPQEVIGPKIIMILSVVAIFLAAVIKICPRRYNMPVGGGVGGRGGTEAAPSGKL